MEKDNDELMAIYQDGMEFKNAFANGYVAGTKHSNWIEKRNKTLETSLMELIGLDEGWLLTNAGYKKRNKTELIQIIMEQRQLLKMLFENLEEEKKKDLIEKVESIVFENVDHDMNRS